MGRGDCIGVCVAEDVVFGDCEATLLAPSDEAEEADEEEDEADDEEEEAEDTPDDVEDALEECAESGGWLWLWACGWLCGWLCGEELPEAPDELEATSSAPPSGKKRARPL